MPFYQFKKTQTIHATLDEVWEFVSAPVNLKLITPPEMGFDILTGNADQSMYEGMIIAYEVSPLMGIRTQWVTEITHVRDRKFFVDEQRIGPYKMWHHQHILEPAGNKVLMKDIITYQPPMGALGAVANQLIIRPKLEKIFKYRKQAIEEHFEVKPTIEWISA